MCTLSNMASITRAPTPSGRYGDVEGRLLAATEELLREGATFTELGVQRVTAQAGVARSTFYVYFSDKTELLLRLTQRLGEVSFGFFDSWSPEDEEAMEELVRRFVDVTAHYRRNSHLLTAVLEVAAYDREFAMFWKQRLDPFLENVTAMLRAEQAAGRTASSFDPAAASRVMVSSAMQAIAQQIVHGDPSGDEQTARELAYQEWYGTYRRPDIG
jgi:AcrR family transcriptional regulator